MGSAEILNIEDARQRERMTGLKKRYLAIAELYDISTDGITPDELADIEKTLSVSLPEDMKYIASFYDGDALGGEPVCAARDFSFSIDGNLLTAELTDGAGEVHTLYIALHTAHA